jgi:multiple sugar transport system ATP-binding protein
MASVTLSGVTKVFPGGTLAVDDVSLDVEDGEFIVLVGPSGCGKSTVLRLVAGLEEITAGTILIDGGVVNDLPPKDRDIAMVFQNYALYPHMTVADNLSFSLRIGRMPKARIHDQVSETAQVLGLQQLLTRKPAALSGGQRQRVAMGRAIVRQPRVFLMDEPLSNLDAKLRVAMRGELSRLHQKYETTTLYVTHDQVEAMTLGHRIAVLDRGRLQQVGTPDEVYDAPRNIFVAGFIGSPAMNLARALLLDAPDGPVLATGEFRWPVPARQFQLRPSLRSYIGRSVVFGVRPNQLRVPTPATPASAPRLRVVPVTVESLGGERNVLFAPPLGTVTDRATGGAPPNGSAPDATVDQSEAIDLWTARLFTWGQAHRGEPIELTIDLDGAHFFDPDTTTAIPIEQAAAQPVLVTSSP